MNMAKVRFRAEVDCAALSDAASVTGKSPASSVALVFGGYAKSVGHTNAASAAADAE